MKEPSKLRNGHQDIIDNDFTCRMCDHSLKSINDVTLLLKSVTHYEIKGPTFVM
jgi:hypothetical protein